MAGPDGGRIARFFGDGKKSLRAWVRLVSVKARDPPRCAEVRRDEPIGLRCHQYLTSPGLALLMCRACSCLFGCDLTLTFP